MTLQERIKEALKKKGLPVELYSKITVEDDDETKVDEAVEAFAETYTPPKKTFAEYIKDEGYEEDLTKLIQSETDKRVTQALETFSKKLSKETDKDNKNKSGDDKYDELLDKINGLTESLQGQQDAQKKLELKGAIEKALEDKKLPKSWVGRIDVSDEAEIEAAVKTLEDEFNEIKQGIVDDSLEDEGVPGFGVKEGSSTKAKIKEFATTLEKEGKDMKIQKLE